MPTITFVVRFGVIVVLAFAGFGGTTGRALPQTPPLKLTPASVALLANKWGDDAVLTARRAISDDDPAVRAVAARLAGAADAVGLADAVALALEREQNPLVAVEQARALLHLRPVVAEPVIKSRLKSTEMAVLYAEWLSRVRPDALADEVLSIAPSLSSDRMDLVPHILTALGRRPQSSERLLRGWLDASTAQSWRMFLDRLLLDASRPGQDLVLVEALNSKDGGIREATVWNLVVRLAQQRPVPAAILDAALPVAAQDATASATWEQFGREIIARIHGNRQTDDRSSLLTAEASAHFEDSQALFVLAQITDSERRALKGVLGNLLLERPRYLILAPIARVVAPTRTVPIVWPGLLSELAVTAGCKSTSDPGLASVTYRSDGRVERVGINQDDLSPGCIQVIGALARLSIADAELPTTSASETLVLPLDRDYIECASRTDSRLPGQSARVDPNSRILPPKKIRDVKPIYPAEMVQRRIAGAVVLDAWVSEAGCVPRVRVIRSVAPSLDHAAVHAVSGWRYTPVKVDGQVTPAVMSVTVNFQLQ